MLLRPKRAHPLRVFERSREHTHTHTHTRSASPNQEEHDAAKAKVQHTTGVSGSGSAMSDSETPWTTQSMGFSRPEYWGGRLSHLQEIFPTQVSCIAGRFFTS